MDVLETALISDMLSDEIARQYISAKITEEHFLNTDNRNMFRALRNVKGDYDIVIIAIDDESLQDLGRWPWSRDYFAKAIDDLNQSRIIGVDISFFEPFNNDSILADSIKNNNVVLAMEYTSFSIINGELYGDSLLKPTSTLGIEGVDYKTGFVNLYTDSDGVTRSYTPYIKGILQQIIQRNCHRRLP